MVLCFLHSLALEAMRYVREKSRAMILVITRSRYFSFLSIAAKRNTILLCHGLILILQSPCDHICTAAPNQKVKKGAYNIFYAYHSAFMCATMCYIKDHIDLVFSWVFFRS